MSSIQEIAELLDVQSWPARFKALSHAKKILAVIGAFALVILALVVLGHINKIGVSVGPSDTDDRLEIPVKIFVIACSVSALLVLLTAIFMSMTVTKQAEKQITTPKRPATLTRKLRVYAILPTGPTGRTQGDGLLQAAGFLAGGEAFKSHLELVFMDHQNDSHVNPNRSKEIVQEIIQQNRLSRDPICMIFTMSTICRSVHEAMKREFKIDPSLKERTSVIFTVASAPNTPRDGENFFQHFVSGDQEAEAVVRHCKALKKIWFSPHVIPKAILLVMESPYSKQTVGTIANGLIDLGFEVKKISVGPRGEFDGTDFEYLHNNIKEKQEQIAVSVAYDLALVESIRTLYELGFSVHFLATTTLSVGDWRQYFLSQIRVPRTDFRLWYTRVSGFDSDSAYAQYFAEKLKPWTFSAVLGEEALYGPDKEWATSQFGELERSVYKEILPNYISAFCFDSIRLFYEMYVGGYRRLADLTLPTDDELAVTLSPYEGLWFDGRGKTLVRLESEEIKFVQSPHERSQVRKMRKVLVVVDVQRDFCKGGSLYVEGADLLIDPINDAIAEALRRNMIIIFSRDWHPANHQSFKQFGGQWPAHCVRNTPGAKFHRRLRVPEGSLIVNAGSEPDSLGYSPYEDPKMVSIIDRPDVGAVYVLGIALEYCVRLTCIETLKRRKKVVALEPLIAPMKKDPVSLSERWRELESCGVIRSVTIT